MISSTSPRAATPQINSTAKVKDSDMARSLVPWKGSSLALGGVQVRACRRRKATRCVDTQGRRGRDTGSYVDRGERREVRAWAARSVKRFPFQGLGAPHAHRGSPRADAP